MEKKTIGAFLAVLRKANGMTQQEVADRLNVSNKTVSKWECDESLPDITLIPALAEMFSVTADEILRGRRMQKEEAPAQEERRAEKTAAQARSLMVRTMAKHLNGLTIAAAVLAAGMIALFTVSYAFYRPLLGFGIFLVMLLGAEVFGLLTFNSARTALIGSGLLTGEEERAATVQLMRRTLGLIRAGAAAVVFALPLVLLRSDIYVNSVVSASTYLELLPVLIAAAGLVMLLTEWICGLLRPELGADRKDSRKRLKRLYLCAGCTLALVLMTAFSGVMNATNTVTVTSDVHFTVFFDDESAAKEYRGMTDDYAQGGEAWKEYCRANLQERGLPWKGSIDDFVRDELSAQGYLDQGAEFSGDDLIEAGYGWAFIPDLQSISGTEVSFHLERYRVGDSEEQFGFLIFALLAAVIVAAAVILGRRAILADAEAKEPHEEDPAAGGGETGA
ncbi:MAG: helix-turn-helix transcriptional regulator [Clostridia bacterium]|nr:helix-turn-helix transcriptional regulator [Clostridia bacterium]